MTPDRFGQPRPPVAQTFFMDEEMKDNLRLDGIVTVVDCKHVAEHLDHNDECRAQIAFADTQSHHGPVASDHRAD
jgi:G3E family GTPase